MKRKWEDEKWLRQEYVEKGQSTTKIAEEIDVTHATVSHYLDKFGIVEGRERRVEYKYICPDCQFPQRNPSQHLTTSDCNRPEINYIEEEMLKGLIMGDGSILTNSTNWSVVWNSTNRAFMEWFDWRIGDIGIDVSFCRTGDKQAEKLTEQMGGEHSCRDIYAWKSITHPKINDIFSNWLREGEEKALVRYPDTLELTPISLCIWFCSDGSLSWVGRGRNFGSLRITTVNESGREEYIKGIFNEIGFDPVFDTVEKEESFGCENPHTKTNIRFSKKQSLELLQWMGGAPPGMEYKWETDNYEEYKRLQEKAYQ